MKSGDIKKTAVKLTAVVLGLLVIDLFFCGLFSPLPYRSLAPFKGKVVDAETKQPIAGAVVLAVYESTAYTLAGDVGVIVDGRETLTDENGEFRLPRKRRWLVLRRGYPEGQLTIFKPGYGAFPWHERTTAVGENKAWPSPGKHILYELPKLHTITDRRDNVRFINRYNEIPHTQKQIYWDQVNNERKYVGLPLRTPDE
jgi:hypothetical protein